MLGLPNVNGLTHQIENIFEAGRSGSMRMTSEVVETVLNSLGVLEEMMTLLQESGTDDIAHEKESQQMSSLLQLSGCEKQQTSQEDAEAAMNVDLTDPDVPPLETEGSEITIQADTESASTAVDIPEPAAQIDHFEGIVDETEVPAKYLAILIDETELAIESLTESLLSDEQLEGPEAVDNLMIVSHRIKGAAASVGLNRPARLAHFMEDILQELRESSERLWPEMTDALLKCTDALRHYLNGLREGAPDSGKFAEAAMELLSAKGSKPQSGTDIIAPAANATAEISPLSAESPTTQRTTSATGASRQTLESDAQTRSLLKSSWDQQNRLIGGIVRLQVGLPLVGLKGQLIVEKLRKMGALSYIDPAADGICDREEFSLITFALHSDVDLQDLEGRLNISGVEHIDICVLCEQVKTESDSVASPQAVKTARAHPPEKPVVETSKATPDKTTRPNETLRVDIDRLDQLMNLAGQLVINKARFTQIGERLKEHVPGKQTPNLVSGAQLMTSRILSNLGDNADSPGAVLDITSLRSHTRVLQSNLETIGRELQHLSNVRSGVSDLFEAIHQLDRVAGGMQKGVMDTRMVPIGPLFGRFRRVVRDISRGNGKEIRLEIHGDKTELDKRMIDELGDPLIHMVRNSADHGIEPPDDREAAGKDRQGTITLDALHRGNSIVIEIHDDGKGLDADRIAAKGIEKGIITEADAARMTPHQLYQLIWEPGFSTAAKVTEVSGRGMGMDIVRTKIEEINGVVEVDSVPGQGCIFRIKLPLTLAILPSLLARIDGDVFAMPVESIVEIVSVSHSDISTVHGLITATIRGRVISVTRLDMLFDWTDMNETAVAPEAGDCTLVVIGHEGQELGLIVDDLLGEEDLVIKSMAENYRNVAGIAGASILGNGSVSLILDTTTLIDMATHVAAK